MRNIMHRDLESVSLPSLNVHVFIIFDFDFFFQLRANTYHLRQHSKDFETMPRQSLFSVDV